MSVIQYAIDAQEHPDIGGPGYLVRKNLIAQNLFITYPRFLKAIVKFESKQECLKHLELNDQRLVDIITGENYPFYRGRILHNIEQYAIRRMASTFNDLWDLRAVLGGFVDDEKPSNFRKRLRDGTALVDNEAVMRNIFDFV